MRPEILNPLFRPVTSLPGIGPKLAAAVTRLLLGAEAAGPARVIDLLFHLPTGLIDRRRQPGIAAAPEGTIVTLKVRIDRHKPVPASNVRAPYKVFAHDDTGEIGLVFFHGNKSWLEQTMPVGETRYVSGRVEWFNGAPQMVHPDHIVDEAGFAELPLIEPVYPLTAGLSGKVLRRAIAAALNELPDLPEWTDRHLLAREHFPSFAEALRRTHEPQEPGDLDPAAAHFARLTHDEFLASQLALALMRNRLKKAAGRARQSAGTIKSRILAALPFSLTGSQEQSIAEIEADLAKPERMLRLLQGDVGAGKTVVALIAMTHAVEAGGQAAIMAPTELLVRQHHRTIAPLADAVGLRVAALTGREKGRAREDILGALAAGDIDILIGTHALFQSEITFKDLALAVVDEQHRFGVHQRLALAAKGDAVDVLVMTATPIPRTLVLSHFGDMDVSQLTDKPAGRRPIATRTIPLERIGEVVDRIGAQITTGDTRVYWVCPLVEESEAVDLAAAEERYAELRAVFGDRVGLVHGRMKGRDKDAAMQAFKDGETRLLVGTTVVEVGVDVSDATIMLVEHAERFGLAQLHQLRGRVGRGDRQSSCVLLYKSPLGEIARARLSVMRETEDGFRIAEEDL
ncbi:MAG: ATP-dependent DNA helicase RecG, partial [Hyphomicrobiales bacterium]|nr:ATP-dependent DNA helicase RecG [Hyphomicrobiales bacterium]